MSEDNNCFFCDSKCEVYTVPLFHRLKQYECEYCGIYILADSPGIYDIDIKNPSIKFKIACVLNERRLKGLSRVALVGKTGTNAKINDFTIIQIDDLLDEFPKKASEFLNRALLNLSRLSKRPFNVFPIDVYDSSPYNLYFFTENGEDCKTTIKELMNQDLIRYEFVSPESCNISLTAKAWEIIDTLRNSATDSKNAFVAMWFNSSMDKYYSEGIKIAIKDAGYTAVKINTKEFNGEICDEIIAEIKRTKFLIADFSGLRSGVFFEAGFAKGLGREVIFTVREEDVEKLKEHFDTRQYNHIVYDSPEDLRKKLYNRICATIV